MFKYLLLFVVVCSLIILSCIDTNLISPKTQFKNDTASINNYLKKSNLFDSIKGVAGGGMYIIDSSAVGIYPVLSDSIKISYVAQIINHDLSLTKVDVDTVTVLLSSVMAGWQTTIPRITTGSKGRLFIPSGLAYGAVPYVINKTVIPANSNLIYNFNLLRTKGTHWAADTTIIGYYLSQQGILPIVDYSGVRYTIDTLGKGAMPALNDSFKVHFKWNILNDTVISDSVATLSLGDQVPAWKIILPKIKQGSFIRMYVPSGYGYGSTSPNSKIPANANLVYQLKLDSVIHR